MTAGISTAIDESNTTAHRRKSARISRLSTSTRIRDSLKNPQGKGKSMDPTQQRLIEALMAQGKIPGKMMPQGAQPIAPGFEMLPQAQGGQGQSPVASALMGSPTVQMPIGLGGETEMRSAGVGQPGPAPNAMAQYARGIARDVTSDPWGAAGGLANFATMGAGNDVAAAGNAVNSVNRALMRREARSFTESGARKNGLEQVDLWAGRKKESDAAFNARPEVTLSRQPHWEVQGKDASGRFQKLTPEAREARDRGIELRRREQAAIERANKWSEGSN